MKQIPAAGFLNIYSNPEPAELIERPNRFVMIVKDRDGHILRAHCPNPGKLTEFLIPGQAVVIERRHQSRPESIRPEPERKTSCTAVAVHYKDKIIHLSSSKANDIALHLVLPELHPRRTILPEWKIGRSRFDFLIKGAAGPDQSLPEPLPDLLVEVKSCSLSEHGLAMFPDAPTQRGTRHIEELIALASGKAAAQRYGAEILFIISHGDTRQFMPNPHTDPEFCKALHRARSVFPVRAVSTAGDSRGNVRVVNREIPIDTETPAMLAEQNGGVYLLVIRLEHQQKIPVPRIGSPVLPPGYYIYTGSAKTSLRQRIARHLRKKKTLHWHIDHLTQTGTSVKAFPILTQNNLECTLARDISEAAKTAVPGFGCSDCACPSHLFHFSANPLHNGAVLETLFLYRHVRFL